mmetsp:Transcript_23511/g.76487  ORF Transcript_23511/g.76487 Transcript_23511/m.76487 type:complete len:228 (-) Transcript_23511:636-1319(-)
MSVLRGVFLAVAVSGVAAKASPPPPPPPFSPPVPEEVVTNIEVEMTVGGEQLVYLHGEHFVQASKYYCCFDLEEAECVEDKQTEARFFSTEEVICTLTLKEEKHHDLFVSLMKKDEFDLEDHTVKIDTVNVLKCVDTMCHVLDPHTDHRGPHTDPESVAAAVLIVLFIAALAGFLYMVHLGKNDPNRTSRLSRMYHALKSANGAGLIDEEYDAQQEELRDYAAPSSI